MNLKLDWLVSGLLDTTKLVGLLVYCVDAYARSFAATEAETIEAEKNMTSNITNNNTSISSMDVVVAGGPSAAWLVSSLSLILTILWVLRVHQAEAIAGQRVLAIPALCWCVAMPVLYFPVAYWVSSPALVAVVLILGVVVFWGSVVIAESCDRRHFSDQELAAMRPQLRLAFRNQIPLLGAWAAYSMSDDEMVFIKCINSAFDHSFYREVLRFVQDFLSHSQRIDVEDC